MSWSIILFLGPLGAFFVVAILFVFGLLWSPFAALICALIAHRRALPIRRYTLAGAVYSILFFLPWVYLVARMLRKSITKPIVVAVYASLYGLVWLYGMAGFAVVVLMTSSNSQSFNAIGSIVAFILSISLCVISMRQFFRRRAYLRDNPDVSQDGVIPNRAYIVPFAHTLGWIPIYLALVAA